MNWIDRAVAAVAPSVALRRIAARQALDVITRARNVYEAARPDRSLDTWLTTGADANAEIGYQLRRIRDRARDLGRNNPHISRAYDIMAAKMVGAGIRPRLAEEVPLQTRERTMAGWAAFVDECDPDRMQDLYGLQMLAVRTMIESGEALVRFYPAPDAGFRVPLKIRILEPDWIDIDQSRVMDDGSRIVQGVEFAADGRRRAYWMFTEHPGSADAFTTRLPASTRVPATFISPLYRKQRPDQIHGVPWAAPVVAKARHLDDIEHARLVRKKIQACFSAFVRTTDATAQLAGMDVVDGRRLQKLSPGVIEYLRPDEDVTFASPPGGEGDEDEQINILHAISAGIGCTYAQMTGDLRQVNYSSMRAGAIDHWSLLDQWQRLIIAPMLCNPMWRGFEQYESLRQRRSELLTVTWDFPERHMVDPETDGKEIDAALLAGRKTFHEVIAGRGRDPEVHIAELRREIVELEGLNLPHQIRVPPLAPPPEPTPPDAAEDGDEDEAAPVTTEAA